ncbi:MAG TPA: adenylate/guanylate cyclase domain-containing protein [Candidatus Acidoferrales bacterium]|nr:adenylate/guanylate cyclase domain-containing protein [Candidatus Acidoferrales bacterium]
MDKTKLIRNLFAPSLRKRMLILTSALVVLISGAVILIVRDEVHDLTDSKIQQDFANTYQTFKRFLSLRNQRLVESCKLISELPVLKAQLSTKDPATIRDYVLNRQESPAKLVHVDLFTLTNEKGEVLFRLDHPEKFGDTLASQPSVSRALSGKDPSTDDISIWIINDKLYQAVTVPIFQDFLIGTLTLGNLITQEEAQSLKHDTQSDISFIQGNRVEASTLSDIAQLDLLKSYLVNRGSIDSLLNAGKTFEQNVMLNGENFLCAYSQASEGNNAVYVMSVSMDHALASFRTIKNVIIAVGIVALIVAIVGAFLIAQGISSPVRKLVSGTEQILKGNYDFQIEVKSKDEIGMLAHSFNEMIFGLKERFLMSKFISSSTVRMIQQDGGKIQLGGERRNVTVLFSDIRGFTSISERVEPEVVIELLNAYLSLQAKIVTKYNGVVDKYVGDELIAIFEGEKMADEAVLCAAEIQNEIGKIDARDREEIKVGIGINTGMAIVGNVGSEDRMDHTVLGNNMNLGARLCSIAQPGQIIISESSWRLLTTKEIHTKPLEAIAVRGMSRPVQTYEVEY